MMNQQSCHYGWLSALLLLGLPACLSDPLAGKSLSPAGMDSASTPSPDGLALDAGGIDSPALVGLCGDGKRTPDESCDDGNTVSEDGCSAACQVEPGWTCVQGAPCVPVCGDGLSVGLESCDDGNNFDGDGCSRTCKIEACWVCAGGSCVRASGCNNGPDAEPPIKVGPSLCGNDIVDQDEQCDDGNTIDGDGCSSRCLVEPCWANCGCSVSLPCSPLRICGDGKLDLNEDCDDGNVVSGDGCSNSCQMEPGWTCFEPGRPCSPVCGDGLVVGAESCDDGNNLDGDGCDSHCQREACRTCSGDTCVYRSCADGGASEVVQARCGDGVVSPGEQCDDGTGNGSPGYGGCTSQCMWGPYCGDGVKNGPEQCDDGLNQTSYGKSACTPTCTVAAYCGDGKVDSVFGEQCDLGPLNGVSNDAGLYLCNQVCKAIVD